MSIKKKLLSLATILTLSCNMLVGCTKNIETTQTAYNNLFKDDEVMDVYIEMDDKDWQDILDNASNEEYHSANIKIGDTTLENVGIRAKGNSSLSSIVSSDSDRYSFRVKLDKYVDGQTLNGLNELVLNNQFQDPSYMREYLTYKALEELGVDVPECSFSNIYINGELFGFYLAVEAIDDSFVERIADDNSKDVKLYKAEGENATFVDEKTLDNFELKYGDDDSMAGLKKLLTAVDSIKDGDKGDIESIFDVDTFLKSIAVNTVLGNYDSYSGSKAHNYFLLEEDGKFKYIPWDFNMSFGGFTEDQGASVTVSIDEPVYNVDESQRPLIEKLLSVDEYKEKYYEYLQQLVDYYDDFENQVSELSDLIKEDVENDPSAFYTIEQFEKNITTSDTDLSTVESTNKGNGAPPNKQNTANGEKPELPDGDTTPTDGEKPELPDGATAPTDGEKPELPDGATAPTDGEKPELPDGATAPTDSEDSKNGNKNNKPGGMNLSGNVVSIMDYLQQRIENIKTQLDKKN